MFKAKKNKLEIFVKTFITKILQKNEKNITTVKNIVF